MFNLKFKLSAYTAAETFSFFTVNGFLDKLVIVFVLTKINKMDPRVPGTTSVLILKTHSN